MFGEPDFNTPESLVKQDWHMSIKVCGELYVYKQTIVDITKQIEKCMSKYILSPSITVLPVKLKKNMFTISGYVENPGLYEIHNGLTLSRAIYLAGGLASKQDLNTLDPYTSYIKRDDMVMNIDIKNLLVSGAPRDIELKHNDHIFVNVSQKDKVFVLGEVYYPKKVEYGEKISIIEAISIAGGVKEDNASYGYVIRQNNSESNVYQFKIDDLFNGEMSDFYLKKNDIIYFSRNKLQKWNNIMTKVFPSIVAAEKLKYIRQ